MLEVATISRKWVPPQLNFSRKKKRPTGGSPAGPCQLALKFSLGFMLEVATISRKSLPPLTKSFPQIKLKIGGDFPEVPATQDIFYKGILGPCQTASFFSEGIWQAYIFPL